MDTIKVGKFIAALRREQNMTQEALGERLGVTNKTISRWETGTYLPTLEMLQQLSEVFSVTVDELLQGQRQTTASPTAERQPIVLAEPADTSSFTLEEQKRYWGSRWIRKHTPLWVAILVLLVLDFIWGKMAASSLAVGLWPIGLLILFAVARNRMMIYIESKIYPDPRRDQRRDR